MLIAVAALVLFQSADTVRRPAPRAAQMASAYEDDATREMVRRARERCTELDNSIESYQVLAKERQYVGARVLGRERTLFTQETAARVEWQREGAVRVEYVGARGVEPGGTQHVPTDLLESTPDFVFDPSSAGFCTGILSVGKDGFSHPLAVGSEVDYRFRTGGTSSIRLPSGEAIRIIELRVEPRRRDFRLIGGSLWLDAEDQALVRAAFRLSRPFNARLDINRTDSSVAINAGAGKGDDDEYPGWLPNMEADLRYMTIEYGLHQGRWWLPQSMAMEGAARVGGFSGNIRYERAYSGYQLDVRPDAPRTTAVTDSAAAKCPKDVKPCSCENGRCRIYEVSIAVDSAALLTAAELPPSLRDPNVPLLGGKEADALAKEIQDMFPVPWVPSRPDLVWDGVPPGMVRYNRIEGLSMGTRLRAEMDPFRAVAAVRVGVADLHPNADLALERQGATAVLRLGAYHRLAAVNTDSRALGFGNSVSALLWGRDDGDYFRTTGVELTGAPAPTESQRYAWRFFAEQQRSAAKNTDFSIANLLGENDFRANIDADRATQLGAALDLRTFRGAMETGFRWSAEAHLDGATGSFQFARPALTLGAAAPLPGPLAGAVEVGAGTSVGDLPVQSLWYLGGPSTLRGFGGNAARGEAFWRARAELASALSFGRLVLFSDAGWAGPRDTFGLNPALISAGAGLSFLDGLLRLDVARALRGGNEWRVDLYLDAAL